MARATPRSPASSRPAAKATPLAGPKAAAKPPARPPRRHLTPADYLQKILNARVYDVAIESELEQARQLSQRLGAPNTLAEA